MDSMVSVIIPAYNAQSYIADALSSVLSQTYSHIEVIVVNDGSTDDTLRICQQIALRDERIILIDKKNEGVSSARNAALDMAKGDLITFVDADDIIAPDMLKTLVDALIAENADVAQCDYYMASDVALCSAQQATRKIDKQSFYNEQICGEMLALGRLNTYLCSKMFTRSAVGALRFDKRLITGEDFEFTYRALRECRCAVVTDYIGYYYIRRPNTCTTGMIKEEFFRSLERFHDMRDAEENPTLRTAWGIYLSSFAGFLMIRVIESRVCTEKLPLLRRDSIDYFWRPHSGYITPAGRKLQLILLTFTPHFYYLLMRWKHKKK